MAWFVSPSPMVPWIVLAPSSCVLHKLSLFWFLLCSNCPASSKVSSRPHDYPRDGNKKRTRMRTMGPTPTARKSKGPPPGVRDLNTLMTTGRQPICCYLPLWLDILSDLGCRGAVAFLCGAFAFLLISFYAIFWMASIKFKPCGDQQIIVTPFCVQNCTKGMSSEWWCCGKYTTT